MEVIKYMKELKRYCNATNCENCKYKGYLSDNNKYKGYLPCNNKKYWFEEVE